MKLAETVTFAGSGYDRCAELRGDVDAVVRLRQDPHARAIVLWRGKLMLAGSDLVQLPLDHALLDLSQMPAILLGRVPHPVFAYDISNWEPADLDADQLAAFIDLTEQHHPLTPADHIFRELRSVMTLLSAQDAELASTAKALFSWHSSHRFCAVCGTQSVMTMDGWQRNCQSCNASHFPRTDPVVIMLITRGNDVLVGRSPGWPEGMYSTLAGFVEPGETIEAAVRREVFEEAGIRVGPVDYLASQPWAFPSSLMFGCRGEALDADITIDPKEIDDALWVSRQRMMDIFAGLDTSILPAREGAIAHFMLRNWLADRLD